MKKFIVLMVLAAFIAGTAAAENEGIDMTRLLPEPEGWTRDGSPQIFTPATLYEYINGAAEVYLSYGFQELVTVTFTDSREHSITVDIYRQNSSNNGFGIYSQEKPLENTFLSMGGQGYYEPGLLNFFKGVFYVKILSFGLGEADSVMVTSIAVDIAGRLPGEDGLPAPLRCFPREGKVANSERYIATNFLGHGFLHSAFVVEYVMKDEKVRPFLIETDGEEEAGAMLGSYLGLLKKNDIDYKVKKDRYLFQDPYFEKEKRMYLKQSGRMLWGVLAVDRSVGEFYISEIEKGLKEVGLLR